MYGHFNPRSPHGERQRHNSGTSEYDYFNPRSPHGERRVKIFTTKAVRNFNPRSPHGERQRQQMRQINRRRISIHAPRTGSDESPMIQVMVVAHFNPRSPHGERLARRSYKGFSPDISIHAPRTGSDLPFLSDNKCHHLISIHAPRTGSDVRLLDFVIHICKFQSTLPARGATLVAGYKSGDHIISIHAPRTGSDRRRLRSSTTRPHFNPRSPHGERPFPTSTSW